MTYSLLRPFGGIPARPLHAPPRMPLPISAFTHGPRCSQNYRDVCAQAIAEQARHRVVMARLKELEGDRAAYAELVRSYRVELLGGPRCQT